MIIECLVESLALDRFVELIERVLCHIHDIDVVDLPQLLSHVSNSWICHENELNARRGLEVMQLEGISREVVKATV